MKGRFHPYEGTYVTVTYRMLYTVCNIRYNMSHVK